MYPASGNSRSLQVFNKQQSNISDKIGDTQRLDTYVDKKLPNDQDSEVIGPELSHGSSTDLYLLCRMDFASDFV